MHQHYAGSQIARADVASLDFRKRGFRVFGHEQGIPVGAGVRVVEELIQKAVDLLPPALAVGVDFLGRVILIQADEAAGKAVLPSQRIQIAEHGRVGFLRQAVQGDHSQMPVAQARDDAAHQVVTPQQSVQIHGRFRHQHGLKLAAHAMLDVREQIRLQPVFTVRHGVFQQPIHIEDSGERVFQFFQHVLEVDQRLFQSAGRGHARLCLPGQFGRLEVRLVSDSQNGVGAEAPVATEKLPALFINEQRHRIREIPLVRRGVGAV